MPRFWLTPFNQASYAASDIYGRSLTLPMNSVEKKKSPFRQVYMHTSSLLVAGCQIEGVHLKKLARNSDSRGSLTEVFKGNWRTVLEPVQFSIVHSRSNVMRGCHLHWRHDEYFCIIKGAASVGLRDERPESPTRNIWSLYHLCETDMAALVFPRGLVHGWYFHEDSIHLQAVSEAYDDYAHYDNHRIDWQDPDLEIPWPAQDAILTDLAQNAPGLAQVRASRPSG